MFQKTGESGYICARAVDNREEKMKTKISSQKSKQMTTNSMQKHSERDRQVGDSESHTQQKCSNIYPDGSNIGSLKIEVMPNMEPGPPKPAIC